MNNLQYTESLDLLDQPFNEDFLVDLDPSIITDDIFTGLFDIDHLDETSAGVVSDSTVVSDNVTPQIKSEDPILDSDVKKPSVEIPTIASTAELFKPKPTPKRTSKTSKKKTVYDSVYIQRELEKMATSFSELTDIMYKYLIKLEELYPKMDPHEFPNTTLTRKYNITQTELKALNNDIIALLKSVEDYHILCIHKKTGMCRIRYAQGHKKFLYLWFQRIYIPVNSRKHRIVELVPKHVLPLCDDLYSSKLHPITKSFLIALIHFQYTKNTI